MCTSVVVYINPRNAVTRTHARTRTHILHTFALVMSLSPANSALCFFCSVVCTTIMMRNRGHEGNFHVLRQKSTATTYLQTIDPTEAPMEYIVQGLGGRHFLYFYYLCRLILDSVYAILDHQATKPSET